MSPTVIALIVFGCLIAAVLVGRAIRNLLPDEHVTSDSRDAIKLAMGLVATMSALVLGAYDTERSEVIQIAAKVAFLDRVLAVYGPEAAGIRVQVRENVEEGIRQMWPGEMRRPTRVAPDAQAGNMVYGAIQRLSPHSDMQTAAKAQAAALAIDVAQVRSLLAAQSVPSISKPMLIVLVSWLVIIFLGFSVLAPPNGTAILALTVSSLAVSGAIFLILELDEPFGGVIGISSEPLVDTLHQLAKYR
jgi:hypothetical protein